MEGDGEGECRYIGSQGSGWRREGRGIGLIPHAGRATRGLQRCGLFCRRVGFVLASFERTFVDNLVLGFLTPFLLLLLASDFFD